MKKGTFLIFFYLFIHSYKAQIFIEDVVQLKNGSQYKGQIIECIPDSFLSFRTYSNTTIIFQLYEIDSIYKAFFDVGQYNDSVTQRLQYEVRQKFYTCVEVGLGMHEKIVPHQAYDLHMNGIFAYRYKRVALGIGAGLSRYGSLGFWNYLIQKNANEKIEIIPNYLTQSYKNKVLQIPVFSQLLIDLFTTKKRLVSLDLRGGLMVGVNRKYNGPTIAARRFNALITEIKTDYTYKNLRPFISSGVCIANKSIDRLNYFLSLNYVVDFLTIYEHKIGFQTTYTEIGTTTIEKREDIDTTQPIKSQMGFIVVRTGIAF